MMYKNFSNHIRRYILGREYGTHIDIDNDIKEFEIAKLDYRNIFDQPDCNP